MTLRTLWKALPVAGFRKVFSKVVKVVESGNLFSTLAHPKIQRMAGYIGEFPCNDCLRAFSVAGCFERSNPGEKSKKHFVVHRGMEKHLDYLYQEGVEKISEEVEMS